VCRKEKTTTSVAELELEDTCAMANGFQCLFVGDVVGANLCFYPGMVASSTVVARQNSLVGLIRRDTLLKLERVLSVPLESRLRQAATLEHILSMKKTNVLMRVLSAEELASLAAGSSMKVLAPREPLLREGEEVHAFYSLISGNLAHSSAAEAASPRAQAYAAGSEPAADRLYPFSFYSPATHHLPGAVSKKASASESADCYSGKNPILSAHRNWAFPVASAITAMGAAHSLSAVIPRGSSTKYGEASKTAILTISQKVCLQMFVS
jgi:hypothetical protein